MLLRHRPPAIDSQSRTAAAGFEHLDERALAVLGWLNANHVEYILVGPVGEAIRGDREAKGPVAVVPAPYGRNVERLCRALWSAHVRMRIDGESETLPVKMNVEKLLRGGRWTLRCGEHDLDIEGCPSGAPRYQELLYEANRFEVADGIAVEVASPEDLEHFSHVRRTGIAPEFRVTRNTEMPAEQTVGEDTSADAPEAVADAPEAVSDAPEAAADAPDTAPEA